MFALFRKRRERRGRGIEFSDEVVAQVHTDGAVFLHSGKGVVFSCNATGARIWQGLRLGRAVEQIADQLAQEYGVPAATVADDAMGFLQELSKAGILRRWDGHETTL